MKRIRINNDFTFAWAIERNGLAENLSVAINKRLWIRNSTGTEVEINDYTIAGNIISVEVTPILAPIMGRYAFKFQYELPDLGLSDYERLCEVDVDAFIIVPRTAEADDSKDLLVASDMAIGFKGDAFMYADFTPEQLEALKVQGDAFVYADFTPEQLEGLKVKGDTGKYGETKFVINDNMELEQHTLIGDPLNFSLVDGDLVLTEDGETVNLGTVAIKDTYSYDETRIGTWVNGKPIYRKVILLPNNGVNEDIQIVHNLGIELYIHSDIVSNYIDGDNSPSTPLLTGQYQTTSILLTQNNISMYGFHSEPNFTYHLIIEYTKL